MSAAPKIEEAVGELIFRNPLNQRNSLGFCPKCRGHKVQLIDDRYRCLCGEIADQLTLLNAPEIPLLQPRILTTEIALEILDETLELMKDPTVDGGTIFLARRIVFYLPDSPKKNELITLVRQRSKRMYSQNAKWWMIMSGISVAAYLLKQLFQ